MEINYKDKLPDTLVRELKENQELCPDCEGRGFNVDEDGIIICRRCRDGIIKKCGYCGEEIKSICSCKESQEERILKKKEDATKRPLGYLVENQLLGFDPFGKTYLPVQDIRLATSDWVFATKAQTLDLDAYTIFEDACHHLHESVWDSINGEDIDGLQKHLDKFIERFQNHKTYYPDETIWIPIKGE